MYSENFYNYDIESNFLTAPRCIQNKTCTTWLVVDIGRWVVSNARLVSCGVRTKDLEWSSTHCPRIHCWVSVLVAENTNFLIFCACRLHKMPLHQLSNSSFPCDRNAIVGIIWYLASPSQLSPISPILGKLAFFDYFDGFDYHTYLAICVFFVCVVRTVSKIRHASFICHAYHTPNTIHPCCHVFLHRFTNGCLFLVANTRYSRTSSSPSFAFALSSIVRPWNS